MILDPHIRQAMRELIDEGLIEWTGEYRDGQKVWRITDKGVAAADSMKKETNEAEDVRSEVQL
jgi:DNA-binding PadR family transcriptional regulator